MGSIVIDDQPVKMERNIAVFSPLAWLFSAIYKKMDNLPNGPRHRPNESYLMYVVNEEEEDSY